MAEVDLALALQRIGAVRFGEFTLKDGRQSPFYIDLRLLIAHPPVLQQVGVALADRARELPHSCIAGIPYAGLPIGVAMSLASGTPLVYPRKEAKDYGTKRRVEGVFERGDRALVVDDVITSGGAKIEAIAPLREAGLIVEDVLVIVDREQADLGALAAAGLRVHSLMRVRELFAALDAAGAIAEQDLQRAVSFLETGA